MVKLVYTNQYALIIINLNMESNPINTVGAIDMESPGSFSHNDTALFTDLYQLTMVQSYLHQGMFSPATFSLFVRPSSFNRPYLVTAGLGDVLNYLANFSVSKEAIEYLRSTEIFNDDLLEYLQNMHFTGNVRAIPEGRLYFYNEPILEITAPLPEAQIVETLIINQINLQSTIATKAARCVYAAGNRSLSDFSLRRAHGIDAGMKAARCSFLAGFHSTSNVLASKSYGIPVGGTMGHSYITSFDDELESFRVFAKNFPNSTVLLLDTYDTIKAAHKAVTIAKEMESFGYRLQGVRIDSGDLQHLSMNVKKVLLEANLGYVQIIVSGGLDEYAINKLVKSGAPIDGFGVGTRMGVSGDAPWLDMAYKLVKYGDKPVAKLSSGKSTLAGEKQVFRVATSDGQLRNDIIGLANEPGPSNQAYGLLETFMESGKLTKSFPDIYELRKNLQTDFSKLDPKHKALNRPIKYPVRLSNKLKLLQQSTRRQYGM